MSVEMRSLTTLPSLLVVLVTIGCNTTRVTDTSRTGVEQLLISGAIDKSLDRIDFSSLAGRDVFVDDTYLDCVDKKYVVGVIRHRALRERARLVAKAEEADVILEVYCGTVGTDRAEGFLGTPAVSVPGPMPIALPEVKLISQATQYGTAKLGIVAYDAKTKQALSAGGLTRARANDSNFYFLGMGPINTGTVREEVAIAKEGQPTTPGSLIALIDNPTINKPQPHPATPSTEIAQRPARSPVASPPPESPGGSVSPASAADGVSYPWPPSNAPAGTELRRY